VLLPRREELRSRRGGESIISNMQQTPHKKHCLMVLKASHIFAVVDSIKEIDMDKAWFVGYTEPQLATVIESFIKDSDYDFYWLTSHDLVLNREGVDCLIKTLEERDNANTVVTGFCNLSLDDPRVTINIAPYNTGGGLNPNPRTTADFTEMYNFITKERLGEIEGDVFETFFANWGMTGMNKGIWMKHPLRTCTGEPARSDLSFSIRFLEDDESNKILSHKKSFFLHLKITPDLSLTNINWLVGKTPPHLLLDTDGHETRFDFEQETGYFGTPQ